MKLNELSCKRFAGICNRSIAFSDGINVICGKNESGKSTMVNLISRTLFQRAKLDLRGDRAFRDLYFPSARKGSLTAGDFADGSITFETENGTYTLTKEWGADARCMLILPDGTALREQKKIDEVLKEALLYGEGVYSDLLLSSQRNTDTALQTLLDAAKKTDAKAEITDAVSQAFAESDGISTDAVEQAIQAKIDELAGKNWDMERSLPRRKTGGGRWSTGLGRVLKAYYALEDAQAAMEQLSRLEAEADRAAKEYTDLDALTRAAEEAFHQFNTFASSLILQSTRQKEAARAEAALQKLRRVLDDWPGLEQALNRAQALQTEQENRALLDQYEAAKTIVQEIRALEADVADRPCPTDSELAQIKTAQRTIAALENRLCGMNLTAALQMQGGHTVEITSVRTGQRVDISGGVASLSEAVRLVIPGVMEMQLSPADVDAASVERQIAQQRAYIAERFAAYQCSSLEELEALAGTVSSARAKLDAAGTRLALHLGDAAFEELEARAAGITVPVRSKAEIEQDILLLCGGSSLSRFITEKETVLKGYLSEYGTLNDLKAAAFDLKEEWEKAAAAAVEAVNIPPEYATVSDPEAHLNALQSTWKHRLALREDALAGKAAAESRLNQHKADMQGDPAADVEKAERTLAEQTSLLAHWLHIAQVFRQQKEQLQNNPMQDIADHFSRYLGIISGGRISSEFPEGDKLVMQVYSEERLLDYGKLSEGTKETASLAFRLAVLEHLFPEGGIMVLDDPFTDMDAERAERACELVKECAKRHQVIFLTCREEYARMLGGNRILL